MRKVAGLGAGDEFLEFVPPTSQEHETAALAEQSAVDSKSRLSSDRKALRKARLQHRSEPSLRLLRKERDRDPPWRFEAPALPTKAPKLAESTALTATRKTWSVESAEV